MNRYYAYVRVSTTKQGEHGVSLQEQRDAIARYAQQRSLNVVEWFEEQETAAKLGRPLFSRMIRQLKLRRALGVIMHKIDRSARNLRDWADLGELIDAGVQVHFSNEALDLSSRGGRLSADIQAVIASDFIRNLREETKKGFYGRLKQGLFPMPAPVGYLNTGKGQPKAVDPAKAPLVRQCFELYATGKYTVKSLADEMRRRGLRSRKGQAVTWHGMSKILGNPFYTGLLLIKKTQESFVGQHEPIVPRALFTEAQYRLQGKTFRTKVTHDHPFRQLFTCSRCKRSLVPENQKGTVYYRCHQKDCGSPCLRQDRIERAIVDQLTKLEFCQEEKGYFRHRLTLMRQNWVQEQETALKAIELQLSQNRKREGRLTDAYLDGTVEQKLYQERATALRAERCELEHRLKELKDQPTALHTRLEQLLETAGNAYRTYRNTDGEGRKTLIRTVGSNRALDTENPVFMLASPFALVASRFESADGSPTGNRTPIYWLKTSRPSH